MVRRAGRTGRTGHDGRRATGRGVAGPIVMLCCAIGAVGLPALFVGLGVSDDIAVFGITACLFVPLLMLLVRYGGRTDGRAPSRAMRRRGRAFAVAALLSLALTPVLALTHDLLWITTFWAGAFGLAVARVWGGWGRAASTELHARSTD